jgi:hypothetical protein
MLPSKNLLFFPFLLIFCFIFQPSQLFAANEIQTSSNSSQTSSQPPPSLAGDGGNGAHNKAKSGQTMGGLMIEAGGIIVAVGLTEVPLDGA